MQANIEYVKSFGPYEVEIMSMPEENETPEHVFTVAEANELIPQLRSRFAGIRRAKTILV